MDLTNVVGSRTRGLRYMRRVPLQTDCGRNRWKTDIGSVQLTTPGTVHGVSLVTPLSAGAGETSCSRSAEEHAVHALIIEDETLIALTIEEILSDCGFTSFDVVSSSEEAVRAAAIRCPDLITADVELRLGSGIDAVNSICSGPPIPVIFITGSPSEVRIRMPKHPLIGKPFTNEAVITAVRLALATPEEAKK